MADTAEPMELAFDFEPSGILGLGPDPTLATPLDPPPPTGFVAPSPLQEERAIYSPPPEMDEEPSDFEDDAAAMMDVDQEVLAQEVRNLGESSSSASTQQSEAAKRRRAAIIAASMAQEETQPNLPNAETQETRGESSRALSPDMEFLLDGPVASSSKETYETFIAPPIIESGPAVDAFGHVLPDLAAETADGRIVYFKRRARPRAPEDKVNDKDPLNLLATPLHHLMAEVNEIKSRQKVLELQNEFANEDAQARSKGKGPSTTMWVDKYRPKKFSDLLGEDRVHREVMTWLKEWDKCVFKRIPPKKRRMDDEDKENYYQDALGRPRDRVLLLSGPPGYGKTTLAHIVAKHAGYRTLEINASDDRSAATVTQRIKNAIDAGSGLGAEGRPTCVVIDEIDGASGGGDTSFVRSLIKLIQDVPAKNKGKTPAVPLRRPIICICNDLYASALRPLRPFARIVRFRKPPSQFLVARLRDICDKERLKADLRVLTTLVDMTSADIRSCLNTLQFIKSKSSVVSPDALKSLAVGNKDSGTSLNEAWNHLFIPMAAKQRRKQVGIDNGRYVDRLAFMVQSCGEYDRLAQGCFEHYPNLKPLDASFANICKNHDWLSYYDRLSGRVSERMEFELLAYVPYAIVPWYSHFAAPANATRRAEWPKADYESYQARVANEEIASSLKLGLPPALRSLFSSATTLTELIPLMMRIISPPLKPVNANIVKPAEREVLARLVELMIPLGLSFWQEKTEDGQPMMRLEPAIDVFVHYDGKRAGDIVASRFAVRQLISQAMDAEVARRRGQTGDGPVQTTAEMLAQQYGAAKTGQQAADAAATALAANTDFFGRLRVPAAVAPAGDTETSDAPVAPAAKRFRAVYKFNEGSSAAVRNNIKMSVLM